MIYSVVPRELEAELLADPFLVLDTLGPTDDGPLARATEKGRDLLHAVAGR